MAWIPARTTSATKAEVYKTNPSSRAANSGLTESPPSKLKPASRGTFRAVGAPERSHAMAGNPPTIPAATDHTGKG